MIFKSKAGNGLLAATLLFFGCSSQPVYHPSRQERPAPAQPPSRARDIVRPNKPPPAITPKPADNAPVVNVPLPPRRDDRNNPRVDTPEVLKKNTDNISLTSDLIENKLTINELEAAAADPALASFKPQILLKIGKLYQKNKDPDRASEYYRSLTTMYPQSVYSTQASILMTSLQTSSEADSKVIGAILPLTGRSSSVGQHALNAIRLGLELNKGNKNYRIALFDSKSDADLAVKGVDKLSTEDKAIVILGGFSAKEAAAIAGRAELLSIPFIAFSQKSGLTNTGEYIFRNAITPEMQVDRLVQFAFDKLSAKRFAVLYPNDAYGVEFANVYWDHVLARGGQITAAQTYDPKSTDFSEVTQKLVGTFYEEARAEELEQRIKDDKKAKAEKKKQAAKKGDTEPPKKISSRDHWSEQNILPPIVDFDVLFVPDNSRALGQVLAFMKFNDVTDMNYLGTNLWNTPDLPKRTANEDAGIYFAEALDLADGNTRSSGFFKEYIETYNEEPTLIEVQAFEAARIVKQQIDSGATGRESLAASLRALSPWNGVTGELKMSSQREFVRPINVLTIDAGLVKKVE
jgi:ABC-type branched-subunit amino acid transport system substrate-binding protein